MLLRTLTAGSVSGTDTLVAKTYIIGGVLITTDGTNAAVVALRRDDASGKLIFQISTKTPLFVSGPFSTEGTQSIYISVTGTGASAQVYEWLE